MIVWGQRAFESVHGLEFDDCCMYGLLKWHDPLVIILVKLIWPFYLMSVVFCSLRPWGVYLSGCVKLVLGAALMSLTDWKKGCCQLFPSRFSTFRWPWGSTATPTVTAVCTLAFHEDSIQEVYIFCNFYNKLFKTSRTLQIVLYLS